MTIVDRYLLFMFLKIFLVCFLSFTGLFIVIHIFSNLDELAALAKGVGWPQLLWDFYGPRVAEIFDKSSAIWVLAAAVFSVSLMQRRREMTAIEAAGVTKSRILLPIFVCAVVIIGLTIVNRELVLPNVKNQLVRTPQNWADQEVSMGVFQDMQTGIKVRGETLSLSKQRIIHPVIQLPGDISSFPKIVSESATIVGPTPEHPGGLLLQGVTQPENSLAMTSFGTEERAIVLMPGDQAWLGPQQCFVVCDFDAQEVAYGKKLLPYQSFPEMLTEIRKPRMWFGNNQRINIHARILQPLLDLTLLLLGLPLIVARADKNVFVSAGLCFFIVGAFQLATMGSHAMGAYHLIKPTALAAWLPAILFTPLAIVAMRRINR